MIKLKLSYTRTMGLRARRKGIHDLEVLKILQDLPGLLLLRKEPYVVELRHDFLQALFFLAECS